VSRVKVLVCRPLLAAEPAEEPPSDERAAGLAREPLGDE
jgi:hypothetical protein